MCGPTMDHHMANTYQCCWFDDVIDAHTWYTTHANLIFVIGTW